MQIDWTPTAEAQVGSLSAVLGQGAVRCAGRAVVVQGERLVEDEVFAWEKIQKVFFSPFLHIFSHFYSFHGGY